MSDVEEGAILTLEPLIDAVREGVESAGWTLSGLQKTTSHQFEGRWEGESTRSAYLFFHSEEWADWVSIDVYLDETSRGLTGNLALVVDLVPLGRLGAAGTVMTRLAALSAAALDAGHVRPLTLRLRLDDVATEASEAEAEVRFKVRLSRGTIERGHRAVEALSREAVGAFGQILDAAELRALLARE